MEYDYVERTRDTRPSTHEATPMIKANLLSVSH